MTDEEDVSTQAPGPDPDRPARATGTGPGNPAPSPRPLTPSRPWRAGDDDESRRPDRTRPVASPRVPLGATGPVVRGPLSKPGPLSDVQPAPGLTPPRPWAARDAQEETGAPAQSEIRQPDPQPPAPLADGPRTSPVPGLAPIRPWRSEPAAEQPAPGTPHPSDPDTVLRSMAAELTPERGAETDEERRRRFARQHAAADAARLAARTAEPLTDDGPPPPSYEPDPAVYEVHQVVDETSRRRRLGRRRRANEAAAGALPDQQTAPAEAPPPSAEASGPSSAVAAPASYEPEPLTVPERPEAGVPEAPGAELPADDVASASLSASRSADELSADELSADEPTSVGELPAAVEPGTAAAGQTSPPPAQAAHADVEAAAPRTRWRRGRVVESPLVIPPVRFSEPVAPEPAAGDAGVEPVESVPRTTRAARWLLERTPEPGVEPAVGSGIEHSAQGAAEDVSPAQHDGPPQHEDPIDVTDAPALDLELADEFRGEPEAAVAEPPAEPLPAPATHPAEGEAAATARPTATQRPHRRPWRRRHAAVEDVDEGPFFPPDPVAPPAAVDTVVGVVSTATAPGGAAEVPGPVAEVAGPVVEVAAPVVDVPPPAAAGPSLDLPSVASVLDDVPLPAASEVPAVPVSRNRPRPRPRPPTPADPPTPPSADALPPAPQQIPPAPRRPRPRPAAARAAAAPAAETSTEPDPAGFPSQAAAAATDRSTDTDVATTAVPDTDVPDTVADRDDTDASTTRGPEPAADPDHRSPDISRFLAATEPQPGDTAPEPKEPMRRRRRIRGSRGLRLATRFGIILVVAAVAAVLLRSFVIAPYYIPSPSMEPTLRGGGGTNDRILVDKITYHVHDPHQGDVVVFDRPATWQVTDSTLVKRIIGVPGDIVSLQKGLVYVNGLRLTENYLNQACGSAPTKPLTATTRWTVPMGDYFVMGDNRCNSEDSRMFGPVPRDKIVGRVFLVIWPLNRFGTP